MQLGAHLPLTAFDEQTPCLRELQAFTRTARDAGVERAFVWPLRDEIEQLERCAEIVVA